MEFEKQDVKITTNKKVVKFEVSVNSEIFKSVLRKTETISKQASMTFDIIDQRSIVIEIRKR